MFTVKLFKSCAQYEGATARVSISCPSYEVYDRNNGSITITCYNDNKGTDYHIREGKYESCFIENMAGKTIDRIERSKAAIAAGKVLLAPNSSKKAKTKQGSALNKRKVKSPAKQGKVTRKMAKAAVKKVTDERKV